MIATCPIVGDEAGIAERLAAYIECQSSQIDLAAFQGGLWHGLPGALVSALLVLYVAGIAYRMILRREMDMASLVYAAARLGVVLALATSFSAYSSIFYTVATQGPVELAAMALAPTGLQVASPAANSRAAANDLDALSPLATPATAAAANTQPAAGMALGDAMFIISCVGFSLAARLAQAVILAGGPLFIATALFDLSAGLFAGWLRALATLFLAQAGYAVSAALELSFFAQELQRQPLAPAENGAPLLIGMVFLAVGIAVTVAAVLAGGGLSRLDALRKLVPMPDPRTPPETASAPSSWRVGETRLDHTVSRAQRTSDAVGALATADEERAATPRSPAEAGRNVTVPGSVYEPLTTAGPGLRRPGQLRPSSGASRRDSIS